MQKFCIIENYEFCIHTYYMLLVVFKISERKQNATVVFMVFLPGEESKFLVQRSETVTGITDVLIQSCE